MKLNLLLALIYRYLETSEIIETHLRTYLIHQYFKVRATEMVKVKNNIFTSHLNHPWLWCCVEGNMDM